MIKKLKGDIISARSGELVVSLGPIALEVRVPAHYTLPAGAVELWTHLEINERGWNLFGFITHSELTMFGALLQVPGVGPKSALGILSEAAPDDIFHAVRTQSPEYLKKKGLGLKTAEKVVMHLKGKLDGEEYAASPITHGSVDSDVFEALLSLGYKEAHIREVLPKLDPAKDVHGKLKQALQFLI